MGTAINSKALSRVLAGFTAICTMLCLPQLGAAQEQQKLRIGFIVSLSGPLAEFGAAIRNGVTLAAETHPKVGQTLDTYFEDSRYDSKAAVTNLTKLRSVDRIHAVYVFGGPMSDTLAPIAEKAGFPMFSTEYDTRYTKGRSYVMRFANNAADYAEAVLANLRERQLKSLMIIKVENQYHNTLSTALIERLDANQSAEVAYNFLPGENDFRTAVAKLQGRSFDALGVYLGPAMQHAFLTQLQAANLRYPVFGTDTFESRDENRGVEQTVEGAVYANSSVSPELIKQYEKRFGNTAQIVHAALAYEFTLLLADRVQVRPPTLTAEELLAQVAFEGPRESVCGEYYFRKTPESGAYFSFPIAVRKVHDGLPQIISIRPAP